MKRRTAILTTIFIFLLCSAGGIIASTVHIHLPAWPAATTVPPGYYRVTEAVDGDTFTVDMGGASERIRLIGVDTPETHKPDTPVQCFGPQASDFTASLVKGQAVRLEADPTGTNRDRYQRLLRYAYLADGTLLNKRLIQEGYGFAYLSFPFQKKDDFAAAQSTAQQNIAGLWKACTTKETNGRWQTTGPR